MKNFIRLTALALAAILFSCEDKNNNEEPLQPLFSADKQTVVSGDKVTFTDESLGQPTKWNWEFEGGEPATSELSSPVITYTVPGKYKVKLSVARGGGESVTLEKTDFITVNYPATLTADFKADKVSAYNNEEVQFTDLSTGYPTVWNWEFTPDEGQTISSAAQNPKLIFPVGLYTVKLTVSNAVNNDEEIKENYLEVIDPNAVIAGFSVDHKICYAGMPVKFSDESLGTATQWLWTFEGATPETATSTVQNPEVIYATPGKHKVKLVASNDVKNSTKEIESFISVLPGNLSGIYFFEENVNDYGPYKKHGTINLGTGANAGITFVDDAPRQGRKSAMFERQACIDIEDHEAFNIGNGDFTYSLWGKVTLKNTQLCFFMEGGGNLPAYKSQTYFRVNNHGNNPATDGLQWCAESSIEEGAEKQGSCWVNLKTPFDDGQWHHYVVRRTGMQHDLFVDGVKVGSGVAKYNFMLSDHQPLVIGAMTDNNDPTKRKTYYQGMIDDFIVYKRALSDEEVAILYNY